MLSHYNTEATLDGVLFGLSSVVAKLMSIVMTKPSHSVDLSFAKRIDIFQP